MANSLLQASLNYAAKGWHVFPVHSPVDGRCSCARIDCPSEGKHPRSSHGFRDATIALDTIHQWWATWPNANIGIRTGQSFGRQRKIGMAESAPWKLALAVAVATFTFGHPRSPSGLLPAQSLLGSIPGPRAGMWSVLLRVIFRGIAING